MDIPVEELLQDDLRYRAIIPSLEIIGEASKKVPFQVKRNYPLIPWNTLSDVRNEIAHEYFSVD